MIKKLLLVLLVLLSITASAQDFLGYMNSNYSGVTGTDLQPASVVDSRFYSDFNVLGTSLSLYNNYIGLRHEALDYNSNKFKWYDFNTDNYYAFKETPFQKHLELKNNSKPKSIYLANNIYLPSLMVSINPKNAIAIKWKVRSILNVDGVDADLATLLYKQLYEPTLWVPLINNKNLSVQTMTWAEYGLTYGHVFKAEGEHFFKAAATAKLVEGMSAAYLYLKDFHYEFNNDTVLSISHGEAGYGHSSNFNGSESEISYKPSSEHSFGMDLGFVYEWRPDYLKYKYEMNGEKDLTRNESNKYKLRVGVSVLDIGKVKYKNAEKQTFDPTTSHWDLNTFNPSGITQLDTLLNYKYPDFKANNNSTFSVNLPTVLSAQIDYQLWKDFYVNLTPRYAFQFKNKASKVHEMSTISITPRWDSRHFGVFVPVSYDQMGQVKLGLGLRLGGIIIGTSNILPYVTTNAIYGMDIEAMVKLPVLIPKVKDRDHDNVSDDRDRCRDVPGVWEFYGCPDRDHDHVEDKDDLCPDEPGLPEFSGCPDRDGDKIIDKKDACPDVPGLPQFNGCPDTDGDGIIDKEDDCPTEFGLLQFKGCPDRDNDSIPDKFDQCPDKPGPARNNGCPEVKLILVDSAGASLRTVIQSKDGSFSFDELPADELVRFKLEGDRADTVFDVKVMVGSIAKKAIKDTRDGYLHFIVLHTDVSKLNELKAQDVAIKLDTVEKAIVAKAFSNLEFATGNDVIKKESFSSLDELAGLLAKKPKWRLKISGHTDNQGVAANNLKLSQKRAEAVKKYLVSKGVKDDRFKVEFFGQTQPIADNKTQEGRQKNRRVEMLIIK